MKRVTALGAMLALLLAPVLVSLLKAQSPAQGSGNTWSTMAPLPTPRYYLAAATDPGGKIYAIGGFSNLLGLIQTNEVYDPATNIWSTAAPMPTARYYLAAVALGGKIYAIGGFVLGGSGTSLVEVYDPATNTWSAAAPMLTARYGLAAVAVGGKIYALGGAGTFAAPMNTVEVYDPAANSWTAAAPLPTARAYPAAAVDANGRIYAIGGFNAGQLNTVDVYDPATNTWSAAPPMSSARDSLAAATDASGKIYAMGGNPAGSVPLQVVEAYDPLAGTWSTVAPMPTARFGLAAVTDGGKIYAIGGFGQVGSVPGTLAVNTVEQYSVAPPPSLTYTLTDLGSLRGATWIDQENVRRGPTALNANAQAAGFRLNLAFGDQPIGFLWDKGTFTDLGTGGGAQSYAYGINDAGEIVGTSNFVASSNFTGDLTGNSSRAFIWQNGVMTILDPDPNNWSRAYAINKSGDVAGFISPGGVLPVIWKARVGRTTLTSLPCSLAACQGEALAINDLGQAAGVSVGGNVNAFRPVMWDSNGQPTDLIPAPGDPGTSEANGINNNGVVIGYYQPQPSINNLLHAFRWQSGVFTDLGTIGTDTYSSAWGIDSKGDIVGTSATTFSPILGGDGGRAFLYMAATQTMYDLTALVPGTNWRLNAGYAINDSGQIVGIGIAPDGSVHGFLLTPVITPTTTTISTSGTPSVLGQQVSFTATVTPTQSSSLTLTGNVTFNDGSTLLGTVALSSGTAIFNTAGLAVGTHAVTASYGGDNNFGPSTSSALSQTVNQATTTTTLSASANPANLGQMVTFTATVTVVAPGAGTPTGTVTFRDGETALGTVIVNPAGNATFSTLSLAVGSHSITAAYGGDANFAGSSSSSVSQVISQPATSTTLAVSPNPANLGQTVTFTATVTVVAPGVGTQTGTITFLDGSTILGIGVLSPAGTATLSTSSLVVGNHTVTASYGGDATFAGSTSIGVAVTVQAPPPPVVRITDNETIHVRDAASFPDVFDPENVKLTDAVWVTPLIQVSAPVVEFSAGSIGFSGQSGSQTITVSDIGTASLTVASATVSGSSQFSITQTTCSNGATSFSTALPSGGACVLTIGYSASATPANDTGMLTFTDNAALSNLASIPAGSSFTQSIPLSGTGSTTGPPPPPPAVIPIMDNETIHVTDAESFPDVFDPEKITVTDKVSVVPCDFTLSANSPLSVPVGGSGSTPITIASVNGCNLQVSLTASSPFLGSTVSLPSTATSGEGSTSATLTVSAGPSVTPTSFTVTITGTSGLTHSASVSVNITASISGTIGVVQTLTNAGAINNTGIANALTSKLFAAQSAPNAQTSINTLKAFQNQVQAQAGQHIATSFTLTGVTFNPASTLMANGQALIDSFRVGMIPDPITGYVVNSSGMPAPGATVSIADATGNIVASATSDVTGFYYMATTGILVPGSNYTIRVSGLPSGFTSATPSSQSFTWQGVTVAFSNFVFN